MSQPEFVEPRTPSGPLDIGPEREVYENPARVVLLRFVGTVANEVVANPIHPTLRANEEFVAIRQAEAKVGDPHRIPEQALNQEIIPD